jgi:hypothetical protein
MDYNCYFNIHGSMLIFGLGRLVFSEWQDTNHDMNSFITDPLFVHAESQCNFFNFIFIYFLFLFNQELALTIFP